MVLTLRTRLALSIALVVVAMGIVSTIVGTRLFGDSLLRQVQRNVEQDLNTAYLVYENRLEAIRTRVQLVASDPDVARSAAVGSGPALGGTLADRMAVWGLDFLTVTDARGTVIGRGGNPSATGDDRAGDSIIAEVLDRRTPVA